MGKDYSGETYKIIAGVDEAGRGPLAGPVVAAAVVLPEEFTCREIKDSKQLTPGKRSRIFSVIQENAIGIGVGIIHADEIDRINILQATFKAMRQALENLPLKPEEVFVDGNKTIPYLSIPQTPLIKGDTYHLSIMSASIIAKVTRDQWMEEAHQQFPEYDFNRHKGYGTKEHLRLLRIYGPSPIHRKSFYPVKIRIFDSRLKGFQQLSLNFTEL
jgi:ribonuclease HII